MRQTSIGVCYCRVKKKAHPYGSRISQRVSFGCVIQLILLKMHHLDAIESNLEDWFRDVNRQRG